MLHHAIERVTRGRGTRTPSPPGVKSSDGARAAELAVPLAQDDLAPVYTSLREIVVQLGSNLTITSSGAWVYFTFPGRRTNVMLRYRLPDSWAELSIVKKAVGEERVVQVFREYPLQGGDVSTRGKTETAIWMPTPELDLGAAVAGQRDRLQAAIGVVETLKRWYLQHAEFLHEARGS